MLLEIFSVTYTGLLSEMAVVMNGLSKLGAIQDIKGRSSEGTERPGSSKDSSNSFSTSAYERNMKRRRRFIPDRTLNPNDILPGTLYSLTDLLHDYKIMIAGHQFNVWAGKWMEGTMMSNYGQFISDMSL
jgi:hypothetical protein